MTAVIKDSHQDWIRIVQEETDGAGGILYENVVFEGHPGDIELDVLLPKLGVLARLEDWEL